MEPGLVDGAFSDESSDGGGGSTSQGGGAWSITCHANDPDAEPTERRLDPEYRFDVRAELSPLKTLTDATVSIVRADRDGKTATVASEEPGHALLTPAGPLLVDFAKGALTGDAAPAIGGLATHVGILTLTTDDAVNGLPVACRVSSVNSATAAQSAGQQVLASGVTASQE